MGGPPKVTAVPKFCGGISFHNREFSRDGPLLAVGLDNNVCLWRLTPGSGDQSPWFLQELKRWPGPDYHGHVTAVRFIEYVSWHPLRRRPPIAHAAPHTARPCVPPLRGLPDLAPVPAPFTSGAFQRAALVLWQISLLQNAWQNVAAALASSVRWFKIDIARALTLTFGKQRVDIAAVVAAGSFADRMRSRWKGSTCVTAKTAGSCWLSAWGFWAVGRGVAPAVD